MKTSFYASGFLYNLRNHQILLLSSKKIDDKASSWSMLGGESNEGEEAQVTFQRVVNKLLKIDLKDKDIYPVYDYFHEIQGKINYVFYAEVKDSTEFKSPKENNLSWVSFADTLKFLFSTHTKQDLIVGERVINLKQRLALNLQ